MNNNLIVNIIIIIFIINLNNVYTYKYNNQQSQYNKIYHYQNRESIRCDDKLDIGKCNDERMRYFYNATSMNCEKFTYTGCGGNNNRFLSSIACNVMCKYKRQPIQTPTICYMKNDQHSCGNNNMETRYFYNATSMKCQKFVYSGCSESTKNHFLTINECRQVCEIEDIEKYSQIIQKATNLVMNDTNKDDKKYLPWLD